MNSLEASRVLSVLDEALEALRCGTAGGPGAKGLGLDAPSGRR